MLKPVVSDDHAATLGALKAVAQTYVGNAEDIERRQNEGDEFDLDEKHELMQFANDFITVIANLTIH
jgi:hypothetical protein